MCGRPAILGLVLSLCGACSTIGEDLRTADTLYRDARYEAAEVWTTVLLPERAEMTLTERLRFEYLRGMCAYRLGRPDDALHSLALATELSERQPGALDKQDLSLMARIVEEQLAARRQLANSTARGFH